MTHAQHLHNIHVVLCLLGVAAAVAGIVRFGGVLRFPLGRCSRCHGAGVLTDASGNHFRTCPRCSGNRPLRPGRRALNRATRKD